MGPCGADAFPMSSAGHVLGQERYCPGFYWGWWEWVAWGLSPQITMEHSSLGPLQTTWGQPCAWHATPPAPWICKVPPLSSEGTWAQKDCVSGPGHSALQNLALSLHPEKFRFSH